MVNPTPADRGPCVRFGLALFQQARRGDLACRAATAPGAEDALDRSGLAVNFTGVHPVRADGTRAVSSRT